jgi:hypothetical protein
MPSKLPMPRSTTAGLPLLTTSPDTALPQLDAYHSLFPLDTSNRKNTAIFGYPSWVFKATSSKNGNYYCLRRLEGLYTIYLSLGGCNY